MWPEIVQEDSCVLRVASVFELSRILFLFSASTIRLEIGVHDDGF